MADSASLNRLADPSVAEPEPSAELSGARSDAVRGDVDLSVLGMDFSDLDIGASSTSAGPTQGEELFGAEAGGQDFLTFIGCSDNPDNSFS